MGGGDDEQRSRRTLYVANVVRVKYDSPMATVRPPRSTRDRPAKAPLSERAVLDAALALSRREGLDAVTMRRVAAELDTGAASLYVYVRNRDELVTAMGDRVMTAIELEPADPARWREQLQSLLVRMLDVLRAHPGLAAATLATVPATDPPFDLMEHLIGLLLAGGIGRQDAAWGIDALSLLTTGTAIESDVRADRRGDHPQEMEEMVRGLRDRFASMSPERFPHTVALAEEMTTGDGDERFAFAVDALVEGMLARAARGGGSP